MNKKIMLCVFQTFMSMNWLSRLEQFLWWEMAGTEDNTMVNMDIIFGVTYFVLYTAVSHYKSCAVPTVSTHKYLEEEDFNSFYSYKWWY